MDSEYTRQTRWAHLPDRVAAEPIPAGGFYVMQMVWVACSTCDLQVHVALSHFLIGGVTCPDCGARLAAPEARESAEAEAARVRREEQEMRQQILLP